MSETVSRSALLEALMFLMEETFEGHPTPGNAYLDSGTGWSATLARISASEASQSLVRGGTTIAGHVEHTRYYLAVMREFAAGRTERVDWDDSWRVSQVEEDSWRELGRALAEESQLTRRLMQENELWDADRLGGAIGAIAHCAYHLGAVRQMIKAIRG